MEQCSQNLLPDGMLLASIPPNPFRNPLPDAPTNGVHTDMPRCRPLRHTEWLATTRTAMFTIPLISLQSTGCKPTICAVG